MATASQRRGIQDYTLCCSQEVALASMCRCLAEIRPVVFEYGAVFSPSLSTKWRVVESLLHVCRSRANSPPVELHTGQT